MLQTTVFISGEIIAKELSLSRTTIWKNINQLNAMGLEIECAKIGYRLAAPLEFYDLSVLEDRLKGSLALSFRLTVVDSVASTNELALQKIVSESAAASDPCLQIVLAEEQTSGRGRLGRHWVSPMAKHIYLSIALKHSGALQLLQGLSICIAIAIQKVLVQASFDSVQLKWPNDILIAGKKVGGILVEIKGESNSGYYVVCGVGLNVHLDQELKHYNAVSLCEFQSIRKQDLVVQLILELWVAIKNLTQDGLAPLCHEFNALHCFHDQVINISGQAELKRAKVIGLSPCGGLLVTAGRKTICLYASEIKQDP